MKDRSRVVCEGVCNVHSDKLGVLHLAAATGGRDLDEMLRPRVDSDADPYDSGQCVRGNS